MLDMLQTLLAYAKDYGPVVLEILGALTLLVGLIAKLTPNKKDDALEATLRWLHDKLGALVMHPSLATKRTGLAVLKSGATVVVDHRKK